VLKLNALELAFEFADLSTIGIHRVFDAIPLLVDLFDDDLGIAKASSLLMPRDTAIQSQWIRASYSALLLEAL
jgi:hypothetical protein